MSRLVLAMHDLPVCSGLLPSPPLRALLLGAGSSCDGVCVALFPGFAGAADVMVALAVLLSAA